MKENQNGQIIELVQKVLKEHNQIMENPRIQCLPQSVELFQK